MKRASVLACFYAIGIAGVNSAFAQEPQYDLDYAAHRPIQALDLHTPLRFKPVLGIELGGVALTRGSPDEFAFVEDGNGNPLLNSSDMQGDAGVGFDGVLNLYNFFSDCHAVDVNFRYFSSLGMVYDEHIQGDDVTPSFYQGIPLNAEDERRIEYATDLKSGEANLGFRLIPRTRFIGGFRYMRIDEQLDITVIENGTPNGFFSSTNNRFYGGQVGIEATPITGRWGQIQGGVKYAFGNNNIGGNARAASGSGAPITTEVSGDSNASILDLQLGGTLFLTRSISFYSGYQGLLLDDVGTAPEQVENASIFVPLNAPALTDMQFHGVSFRMVGVW